MMDASTIERIARLILDGNGLGKTGSDVVIACEDGDAANELLDLLLGITDVIPVGANRADGTPAG